MFKRSSDYAINKRSDSIVYSQADGSDIKIRREDCPNFDHWKTLSDEDYHACELHEQRTTRRNISLHDLPDRDSSVEDAVFSEPYQEPVIILAQCLTETQCRRYLLYVRDGKSTRQIAQAEGVSQHAIMVSLQESERKLKIFLKSTFSKR